ncbi:MAG: HD domain-containing protein [Desulfitobacteriaceae bacterium]
MFTLPRVNELIDNPSYESYMIEIEKAEKERRYCKHGFEHGLAVARIAHAFLLEQEETSLSKELIYAAALLHDIGRWVEYQTGEDHAQASARLAFPLLEECGYNSEEIKVIVKAISEHRAHADESLSTLGRALALADDWARDCRQCQAKDGCHKFSEQMLRIIY